jgi:hypothetical protein
MRLVEAITSENLPTPSAKLVSVRWIESTNASVRNTFKIQQKQLKKCMRITTNNILY